MTIEYQLPRRRQPFYSFVKGIIKIFMRKKRVIVLGGELEDKCLYLANHANKMGPMNYDLYFPLYHVKWGAHEMLEGYGERRKYLRDVLYIQKNGVGRRRAAFKAFFEAFFSQFIYKGMKIIPTYPDMRSTRTLKKSVEILENNIALMIFPEDSNSGYNSEITSFFTGFVLVAEIYSRKHGEDVPIRPVYLHRKKRLIVVGEGVTLGKLREQGMQITAMADYMRDRVNELYHRIESGEFDKKKGKNKT